MTREELIRIAADAEPELIEKVAGAINLLEQATPDFYEEVMSDFHTILEIGQEKTAAAEPGIAGKMGLALGVAALAGLGSALANDLYDAARRGLTKSVNFKRILEANPELARAEKAKLRTAYDSLHKFAPDFTSDPMMSGAVLQNLVDAPPGYGHKTIIDLISARKNLHESQPKPFNFSGLSNLVTGGKGDKKGG